MVHIFKQAICDVRKEYSVSIVSVLGNESRAKQEMTFSNEALSDSYDFSIIAQLHQMFEFSKIQGIKFESYDKVQQVVTIGKQNWLLKHNLDGTLDNQKNTQSSIGMESLKGNNIHFIIGGHIHAQRTTEYSSRSGSMPGSNSYNENALGLIGRATHNCYVVRGMERFIQINDIQDVTEVEGYEVISQLEAYNAKSVSKTLKQETVFKIVI